MRGVCVCGREGISGSMGEVGLIGIIKFHVVLFYNIVEFLLLENVGFIREPINRKIQTSDSGTSGFFYEFEEVGRVEFFE
jgi:hypothetical protein